MKKLILVLAACFTSSLIFGQLQDARPVDAYDVPRDVRKAQQKTYPAADIFQWQQHIIKTNADHTEKEYHALFNISGLKGEAIYSPTGEGKYSVVYFDAYEIPGGIVAGLSETYPDYKVTSGKKIRLLQDRNYAYHIELTQNGESMWVWVNLQGKSVDATPILDAFNMNYGNTDLVSR